MGRFGTVHLVAVLAGLITALLLLVWTRGQEHVIGVVAASTEIQSGATIESGDMVVVDMPAGSPFTSVMVDASSIDTLVGQVATRRIQASEPLLSSDIRPVGAQTGRRAMSIALPSSNALGGEIEAGDVVDVLVVSEDETRFVAEAVAVLGVPDRGAGGLVSASTSWWVTLSVDDTDALEIADGVEHGSVYLVRSTGAPALTIRQLDAPALSEAADVRGGGDG